MFYFRAPANCVQYFTGVSGNFQTYNHQGGVQLADQEYNFCFRQEEGTNTTASSSLINDMYFSYRLLPNSGSAKLYCQPRSFHVAAYHWWSCCRSHLHPYCWHGHSKLSAHPWRVQSLDLWWSFGNCWWWYLWWCNHWRSHRWWFWADLCCCRFLSWPILFIHWVLTWLCPSSMCLIEISYKPISTS